MVNDRPPIQGVVGRTSGQIRLTVCENTQQQTIQPKVEQATLRTTTVYTDESSAYNHVSDTGRVHLTVCHSQHEYARDDDGDGVREVHCNTMEGIWTGCGISCGLFGASIKSTSPSMWRSSNGLTT
jgi:transposase